MLCGLAPVHQASVLDGLSFDPFSFQQDGLAAPEVDVSRGEIGDGLVVSQVIVVGDEGGDLGVEIAGQIVVLQKNAVLERLMPALDLALCHGVIGGAADMRHLPVISADLARWLDDRKMPHVRGAPYHPMTQGKIERWHQTLKNRILLENYYLPGDLEAQIAAFVAHYNHLRYHEAIANLTPADVYFGRGQTILLERERIKRQTIQNRRLMHRGKAA